MSRTKFYWTLQFSCWLVYVSYVAAGIYYYIPDKTGVITAALFNLIILIFSTHLYRIIVRNWNIESLRWYYFMIYPVVGNIIISGILCIFNATILHFATYFAYNNTPSLSYFILQFLDCFRFIMPWFVFYHGIRLTERAVQSERDKNEAQVHLKVAELDNLKNQLNPHFLFNSLNSIRSLTLSDPKMAREATTKLSDLLRIALTYNDLQEVPLKEELNLVKDYLSLEKIRFEDRLKFNMEIDRGILNARVLPMSLQLLAENAVKHGIGKSKSGGEILIYAKKKGNDLVLGVRNTGVLTTENNTKNSRKGLGLANLRKRIKLNYGIIDGLIISTADNFVTTEFSVPLKIN
jgi:sensor histidine kinase YesM